jgi:hypothetical protein
MRWRATGDRHDPAAAPVEGAPLFSVGCLGRIGEVEALEDGRFNIVLEGETRFRVMRELDVTTPFRQVEGELMGRDWDRQVLAAGRTRGLRARGAPLCRCTGLCGGLGFGGGLTTLSLINGVSQIVPFDPAPSRRCWKQATCPRAASCLSSCCNSSGGTTDSDDDRVTTLQ